jgi:hypothetical protein
MGKFMIGNGISRAWKNLTREQRLSVGILAVCGLIALMLGVVQLRRSIISPFTAPIENLVLVDELMGPDEEEVVREQQRTDTDGDGISDWHELNVFKTSPYIRDTDSDGEPDNIEIAKGTDPNCPEGQECVTALSADTLATTTRQISLPGGAGETPFPFGGVGGSSPVVPDRDPASIRAFLRARGTSEAELSRFSDEAILEAYDKAAYGSLADQEQSGSEASEGSAGESAESSE